MGCHSLLPRIFPTQWSDLRLLHWQAGSLPSGPPGKPSAGLTDLLNRGLAGELETLGAGGDAPGRVFKFPLYLAPLNE